MDARRPAAPRGGALMSRRLGGVTLDNLTALPPRCRACVRWELDPVARDRSEQSGDPALEKEAWVSSLLLDWGSCGTVVYVDSVLAGFALYAPPVFVPRSIAFPTSPVSPDAVLLMGAQVLQGVAKDLSRRGVRAVEAFGSSPPPHLPARRATGRPGPGDGTATRDDVAREDAQRACLVPTDYLLAVGFKTVRPHPRFPRLRLELKNALSWREDMEVALERLLGSMNPDPALRPI